MRKIKKITTRLGLIISFLIIINTANSQTTFPVNGITEPSQRAYAFTNATIVKAAGTVLTNATLVIRDRKIISVGNNISIPKDAVTIDRKGK